MTSLLPKSKTSQEGLSLTRAERLLFLENGLNTYQLKVYEQLSKLCLEPNLLSADTQIEKHVRFASGHQAETRLARDPSAEAGVLCTV
jgi:hypothetical protein